MNCTKLKKVKYFLEIDENEAKWLKGVMQNPLHGVHPDDEDTEERNNRVNLFDCLSAPNCKSEL